MTKKLISLLTVLIVLFGFIGCPDPDNNKDNNPNDGKEKDTTPTSPAMQVYNSDKTTPYTGEDLDFYIQGDASKTLAATIRSGKLVIRYIDLPVGLTEYQTLSENGDISSVTPADLKRSIITLKSLDDLKSLSFKPTGTGFNVIVYFYSSNGSFVYGTKTHSVKQGWNFTQMSIGSSLNPTDTMFADFRWVIE